METKEDQERAKDQAKAQLESIIDLVDWLDHANQCTDSDCKDGAEGGDYWADSEEYHNSENPQQVISEHPLSIQVRSDWESLSETLTAAEFEILLCTGGPAVRIIGTLNEYHEPDGANIEYQDWFTPWERYPLTDKQEAKVLTYCRQFYFGEG